MYNKIVQLFLLLHFIAPSTQVPLIATSDIFIGSTFINLNCSIWPSAIDASWGLSTISYYLPCGESNIISNHYKMLYVLSILQYVQRQTWLSSKLDCKQCFVKNMQSLRQWLHLSLSSPFYYRILNCRSFKIQAAMSPNLYYSLVSPKLKV